MTENDAFAAALAKASPEMLQRAEERFNEIAAAKRAFMRNALIALDFNGISGDYAEFGCYGGVTMHLAYEAINEGATARHMWAFDSFEGLPPQADERDEHPAWRPRSMAMSETEFIEEMRKRAVDDSAYTTVVGFYDESLPAIGDGAPLDIALAYVDCDMYSSTTSVLDFLSPRLKHGMIVAFDDYFCWSSSALSGERTALLEFIEANSRWNFLRYRDFDFGGTSFVVEDRNLLPANNGAS